MSDQEMSDVMNQPLRAPQATQLDRRELLKGLAIFLGAQVAGLGLGSGCQSDAPHEESRRSLSGATLYQAWAPPAEMTRLGQEILAECDGMTLKIDHFIAELERSAVKPQGMAETSSPPTSAQELATQIFTLHREAIKSKRWVDVQGWRLSEVEAAAYALIALRKS